uniref:monogalactosyldiacylglycerol synthase n=2 Tax=Chromera velia TaxID=505693 RepID=A0A0G4H553_9ALVE|mmetsp:Transcript_42119/g.83157  ORF Transcript_42119/g.83157 Transcript_42119/m.83157 type:complete len:514 (-) Transcript_42119:332-1873(-)|eukprot:Cvel_24725.t1-p1 / transcript=Cvel_24725.t1 / gene=Cvel_24725 / organism=Chromera_velia_CCMP2878 / gene_product=Probable monogalactosyldiacylglycerol synthase,, putative / transcript_product=Probable monogalactosyldiacylglycerol synthase,, putative / location=Cvel_scaffold2713:17801-19339(-) / protein_length=513 / sequence_SO=supercontig / SO=protein_coding / is_pseudo=false
MVTVTKFLFAFASVGVSCAFSAGRVERHSNAWQSGPAPHTSGFLNPPFLSQKLQQHQRGQSSTVSSATATPTRNLGASQGASVNPENGLRSSLAQKKILIVMSDTGGGHKASALAIKGAMEKLYGSTVDIEIVDIWTDYGCWPFNTAVEGYRFASNNPWVWRLFYDQTSNWPAIWAMEQGGYALNRDAFRECLSRHSPDLVLSVHPACQHVVIRALEAMQDEGAVKSPIPLVTVVTDLGSAHPSWFDERVAKLFVPSQNVKRIALRWGVPERKIRLVGLPIREGFWDVKVPPVCVAGEPQAGERGAVRREDYRRELGLREDLPTVLVVGGGEGVGGLQVIMEKLVKVLRKQGRKQPWPRGGVQVVAICGKNDAARNSINEVFGNPVDNVYVKATGFVTDMEKYMCASDCIVTKAGPGTIAEASVCGLPTMLSSYLPGQEAGNVPFVRKNGFGDYSSSPGRIAKTVVSWLQDPEKMREMSTNARKAALPHATVEIAEGIGEGLLGLKPVKQNSS